MKFKDAKIIFLDVDGVLNCTEDFIKHKRSMLVDPVKIKRLHRIVEMTGAKIVLSSTWRQTPDHRQHLLENDVNFEDMTVIHTKVKKMSEGNYIRRGLQIQEWLDEHPKIFSYVIIDDDSDMLDNQKKYFIKTEFETGLQDEHVVKAIEILNRGLK